MPSSPKPWSFSTYTDADGRTYVYGYRNRWDPEKKQSRIEKRCHVGRLDPQTGQVRLGRKFLTNNPEYAGKFWLYDNNQLIEQEPFEQPNTDNEPFAQQFFDEGLHAAAGRCFLKVNKLTDRNAWKTKEIPRKIRDLFTRLCLPLPSRFFRDGEHHAEGFRMPVLSVQMKGELERVSKFRRHVVGRTVGIQNTHIPQGQVEVAVDIQDERSVHPLVGTR